MNDNILISRTDLACKLLRFFETLRVPSEDIQYIADTPVLHCMEDHE